MIRINLLPAESSRTTPARGRPAKACPHTVLGVVRRYSDGQCCKCAKARGKQKREEARATRGLCPHYALGVVWRIDGRCVACRSANMRTWRERNIHYVKATHKEYRSVNKTKIKANQRRWAGIIFPAGVTFESLIEAQNWRCAIGGCDLRLLPPKQVHVDHDHAINDRPNVRGILCHNHNSMIAFAKDEIESLLNGIQYICRGVL